MLTMASRAVERARAKGVPNCIICDRPMRQAIAQGKTHKAARKFWGCTGWPNCDCIAIKSEFDGQWHFSDQALRDARCLAHEAFDRLWLDGRMTRREAYRWLAGVLGIANAKRDCHIGHFDWETVNAIPGLVRTFMRQRREAGRN